MKVVTIHQAKTHLSRLIKEAVAGEEIVIANRDAPVVRLQAICEPRSALRFGGLKPLVLAMGSSFDEPLDDFADYAPVATRVAEPADGET